MQSDFWGLFQEKNIFCVVGNRVLFVVELLLLRCKNIARFSKGGDYSSVLHMFSAAKVSEHGPAMCSQSCPLFVGDLAVLLW
jgi:hypothetical protein